MKPAVGFIVGLFAAWCITLFMPTTVEGQVQVPVGRFQIVNGTPDQARNIMLLDTANGESWVACAGKEAATIWCKIPRSDSFSTPAAGK